MRTKFVIASTASRNRSRSSTCPTTRMRRSKFKTDLQSSRPRRRMETTCARWKGRTAAPKPRAVQERATPTTTAAMPMDKTVGQIQLPPKTTAAASPGKPSPPSPKENPPSQLEESLPTKLAAMQRHLPTKPEERERREKEKEKLATPKAKTPIRAKPPTRARPPSPRLETEAAEALKVGLSAAAAAARDPKALKTVADRHPFPPRPHLQALRPGLPTFQAISRRCRLANRHRCNRLQSHRRRHL